MLKTSGIVLLTLRENLRGQLLWSAAIAGSTLLILLALLSGITLSHESRVIDVFSYFAADQLLLFIAVISGASICSTDFTAKGLAELYVPAGIPRHHLYLSRLFAFAVVNLALALTFFAIKILLLPQMADFPTPPDLNIQLTMLLYVWLKSTTAMSIAGFLGSLVRPIYSILATISLFSFGHLTSSFDALFSASQLQQSPEKLSQTQSLFYTFFKLWNPNLLVVDSLKGEWLQPTFLEMTKGLTWAISFVLISTALTLVRINRIDIRA